MKNEQTYTNFKFSVLLYSQMEEEPLEPIDDDEPFSFSCIASFFIIPRYGDFLFLLGCWNSDIFSHLI